MNYSIKSAFPLCLLAGLLANTGQLFASESVSNMSTTAISFEQAIERGQKYDPWLEMNQYQQDSLKNKSDAAGVLPDPMVSVGLANMPTDTFDFNQEAMTQLKIGLTQKFPRGDTLALKQKQLALMSEQYPYQREDRKAQVVVIVGKLWLDAYAAKKSIDLIERDRELFEYLSEVTQSTYAAGLGKVRQHDIVRAQLELTRLEDRLTRLQEIYATSLAKLATWVQPVESTSPFDITAATEIDIGGHMPEIRMQLPGTTDKLDITSAQLIPYFMTHVSIRGLDQKIEAGRAGVELAKQKYKPQWGLNASYGYRGEDNAGNDRADFFSVGVTFDLPFVSRDRQDKEVRAAVSTNEAIKTEKLIALRRMIAGFESARSRLLQLENRNELYRSRLLREMNEQAEAALSAYTNDDGDFAEAARARIAELNAKIDAINISVDRAKTILELNYYLSTGDKTLLPGGQGWQP